MNVEEEFGVKLIIHEIPVTYEYVAEKVPFLWKAYNPMVCKCFLLECIVQPIINAILSQGYLQHH
jgi:hypothetical protein